jgi:uncharacterized membrane protein YphA (DoxX/SURF4 family)
MEAVGVLQRATALTQRVAAYGVSFPALLTRLVVGYGFYVTGTGKWAHLDKVVGFFQSLGIPHAELQAPMVALLEKFGGPMLIIGLFTRFFAGALGISMVVAIITADRADFLTSLQYGDKVPTDVTSFAYLMLLLWLVFVGAGPLSVDGALGWLLRRQTAKLDVVHPDDTATQTNTRDT